MIEDGVNNKNVRLVWEFAFDFGEELVTVIIKREDFDGRNNVEIASRLKSGGYSYQNNLDRYYEAKLVNELRIFNVNNIKEYKYILSVRFDRSGTSTVATSIVDVKVFGK